jgi:hypothetical protein
MSLSTDRVKHLIMGVPKLARRERRTIYPESDKSPAANKQDTWTHGHGWNLYHNDPISPSILDLLLCYIYQKQLFYYKFLVL